MLRAATKVLHSIVVIYFRPSNEIGLEQDLHKGLAVQASGLRVI